MSTAHEALLARIAAACGEAAVLRGADAAGRRVTGSGHLAGDVPIVRPASTAEVSQIVRWCADVRQPLVPLGGGSGFGGATLVTGGEWYLSLERMRTIESVDPVARVAVAQAGVVLETLQQAVAERGLLFPVDLGGRGSATIGGLISTNAGGERVLRYGMMRENVLGLEAVLADGTVVDAMSGVLKNNAGYDVKQWFIGAEGTLGVVTRASLRLRAAPVSREAAFVALDSLPQVIALLGRLERGLGGTLSAFEVMWSEFYRTMLEAPHGRHRAPVDPGAAFYVLTEAEGADARADRERLEQLLADAMDAGEIRDAALARSLAERDTFWAIRNDIPALAHAWAPRASFDVSVPIDRIEDYARELRAELARRFAGARTLIFGHIADNNLHIAVSTDDVAADREAIAAVVYEGVRTRGGSISAEHGIGLDKRAWLGYTRSDAAIALMRGMKRMLDPGNVLNPGKVL